MRVNTSQNSFDLISIDMSEKDIGSTPIFNGDIVSVFPVNDKIKNAILINGHAPQPGFYSWKEGMKIINRNIVSKIKKSKTKLHVWGTNDKTHILDLIDYGVDGLMVDDCVLLKDILTEKGLW